MRVKHSIVNSLFSIISLILLSVLGFVLTKVFIQILGVEYNGLNGVFTNILSILAITELGIGGAITYNLYKPVANKDYNKITSIMKFYQRCYRIVGFSIFMLSAFVSIFIGIFLKDTTLEINYIRFVFMLFALNTAISYFFSYNRNLFYAYQENYILVIIDFIFRTLKILLQILSLVLYKNYIIFLLINVVFTFGANLTIHLYAKKHFKNINVKNAELDKKLNKKIFKSVKNLAVIQLLSASINFTDNILISSLINVVSAGLYANYNLLFSQIQKIVYGIYNNLGASIGNLVAEDKDGHVKTILVNLEYVSFFLASFCACCFFFLTEPFIQAWLGRQYLLGLPILSMLVFNFYMMIQQQPINYFLSANGLFKKMILPLLIQSILNLSISIILALKFGLIGIFIGTAVSGVVCWIYNSIIIYKHNNMKIISYFARQFAFILLTLVELSILYIIFSIYLPHNLIFRLAYILIFCILLLSIVNIFIIFADKEVIYLKDLLLKLKNKFTKKSIK